MVRVGLALGAILFASLMPTAPAQATPHMKAEARQSQVLRRHVVRLFDELDEISQLIESVRAEITSVRGRISELAREIGAQQEMLNRRAAEAYMSGLAVGVDSLLGATSFTELQDSLEFLDAVARRDLDVLLELQQRKAEAELQQLRLVALEAELRGERRRLEATAAHLVEKLQRLQALLRQRAEEGASVDPPGDSSTPPPSPPAPSLVPGREAVKELIRDRFASLGSRTQDVALCVAVAESNLDPLAENPTSGAAGLFQFLPSTWPILSELAGRGGASVFDARANVSVASWTVAEYGWHPWRSVAEDCQA
jgi:Transglycosylase SLT domain